ncbi:MAG TPA: SprT family zinc-dependent metalloprotease [Novosphingobium sp.]|nr:SprT family zinc-dependent metalloprotease [Novosphingobium sp.]
MLDWLRRDPHQEPVIDLGGKELPVVIRRLDRARRLTMRLAPDGSEVRISIPRWTRTAEALAFAASRRDWLARQLASLPVAEPLTSGATLRFRGEALVLYHDPAASRRPELAEGRLIVGGPELSLQPRLRRWLEGEAREHLGADLAAYCAKAGQAVPPLALSSARRRWGSCAPDGAIRINWRLIMAPDMVRRSVVAHEVAHLVHFDHSPAFHACLADLFGSDLRPANRWLKTHGRELYLPFG